MKWYEQQVSLYKCPADNTGRLVTFRDILFTEFAMEHEWYFKTYNPDKWISGFGNDLETIIDLRTKEMTKEEKVLLKQTLQCYTPAAGLSSKKRGKIEEIHRTGIMQLDFDHDAIKDYDLDELKAAVFDLPFIAFVGLSCSGNGFYALVSIAEPYQLNEYAEHCFEVLNKYSIPPDTTKGRNINDLRFVSYDSKMLIREDPQPLKIRSFKRKEVPVVKISNSEFRSTSNDGLVNHCLRMVAACQVGERWGTVQKAAYTLGGLNDDSLLRQITETIKYSSQFAGLEDKYCECAKVCFNDGRLKPLIKSA
jgi:hypothetical protein